MNLSKGLLIFCILFSLVFTYFSIDLVSSAIRIAKYGQLAESKIISVSYNRRYSPPARIYKMEYKDPANNKIIKDYTNSTTNYDRFKIGETIHMLISYKSYDDFWFPKDLKTKLISALLTCAGLYLITFIVWKYRLEIQEAANKGNIILGE